MVNKTKQLVNKLREITTLLNDITNSIIVPPSLYVAATQSINVNYVLPTVVHGSYKAKAVIPTPIVQPVGKYRTEQPLLFQGVGQGVPGIPGQGTYTMGYRYGPTSVYVDAQAGWRWANKGGDWVDKDSVAQGTKPWAVALQSTTMVAGQVLALEFDATELCNRKSWLAWVIRCPNAQRKMLNNEVSKPYIVYNYIDGTSESQPATIVASNGSGKSTPSLLDALAMFPVMVEFVRPTKELVKATLKFSITGGEWASSGGPARFEVFPLTPPVNTDPVSYGLASGYQLDAGINSNPAVIHAQQFTVDGKFTDYVSSFVGNTDNEMVFDAGLIDPTQPRDLTKLPNVDLGKWVGNTSTWKYLKPGDPDFVPLHPELGAMRVQMKPSQFKGVDGTIRDVQHGDVAGYGGTLSSHAFLYMPPEKIYKQRTLFTRNYVRLSYPNGKPTPSSRKQVWADKVGGQAKWNDLGGKWGLTPGGHHNTLGGYSGTAGGAYGTQFRSGWQECAEGIDGPGEGGWYISFHLYDFGNNRQPPGHNYGALQAHDYCFGQRGGLGSVMYANYWYCIELECTLNNVDQPARLADGSLHIVNGIQQFWTPDGELRAWIDGRLVYEKTGLVFRTLPAVSALPKYGISRPISPIGHVYAGMNIFHGGVSPDSWYRNLDFTGVVVSEARIGPMAGL